MVGSGVASCTREILPGRPFLVGRSTSVGMAFSVGFSLSVERSSLSGRLSSACQPFLVGHCSSVGVDALVSPVLLRGGPSELVLGDVEDEFASLRLCVELGLD